MGHKAYFILIPACHVAEQLTSFSVWWTGSTSTAITPPGSVSFPPLPNRSLTFCPLRPWLGYNIIIVYPTRWQQKTNKLVCRFLQQLFHPEGTIEFIHCLNTADISWPNQSAPVHIITEKRTAWIFKRVKIIGSCGSINCMNIESYKYTVLTKNKIAYSFNFHFYPTIIYS